MDIVGAGVGLQAFSVESTEDFSAPSISSEEFLDEINKIKLTARVFSAWRGGVKDLSLFRRRFERYVQKFSYLHDKQMMRGLFSGWQAHVKERREARAKAGRFLGRKLYNQAKTSFAKWKKFRVENREERVKVFRFIYKRNRSIEKKALSKWTSFVGEKRQARGGLHLPSMESQGLANDFNFGASASFYHDTLQELKRGEAEVSIKPSSEVLGKVTKTSLLKGRVEVQSTFSRTFSQVYSLKSFDKGLLFLRVAAWVATIALAFIPLIAMYGTCKVLDCVSKKS